MTAAKDLAAAYAHCEAVTRDQAANFYYGIRLLPRERRRAMCAVYAFARRVDDIGDGPLQHDEKLRRLDAEALALAGLHPPSGGGEPSAAVAEEDPAPAGAEDPVMTALADAHARFALPPDGLSDLIEGVRMDVEGVTYEHFDDLVLYCRRVAGAIGRVCLSIFGLRSDAGASMHEAERLADDLGVALQLTNILRDVAEDAQNGRVYLPAEDLRRFGVVAEGEGAGRGLAGAHEILAAIAQSSAAESGNGQARPHDRLPELVHFEAERAREWFARGLALAPLLDRRSAACVLAMAGIYRRLLDRIDAQPEHAMRRRVSLPTREKAWVAARGMLGGGAGWS
ncbi:MAG: crtB1 [Solirubrobacterales bacterium]|nr:crtB1 [Solirubrobacterales bacterium]